MSGLRLSASTFFFISRAVCFLPLFWSAWGDTAEGLDSGGDAAQLSREAGGWGCGSQAAQLWACAHLGQVAAVVGAHGRQSLLLLQVVLGSPLGILLLPAGLLLLQRPDATTQGQARCPSPQCPGPPRPALSGSSRSWAGSALSQGCCRALVTGQGWGSSATVGQGPWRARGPVTGGQEGHRPHRQPVLALPLLLGADPLLFGPLRTALLLRPEEWVSPARLALAPRKVTAACLLPDCLRTILSLSAISSSSSFLRASKWLSMRACSSMRSLFCRFFWMSCGQSGRQPHPPPPPPHLAPLCSSRAARPLQPSQKLIVARDPESQGRNRTAHPPLPGMSLGSAQL